MLPLLIQKKKIKALPLFGVLPLLGPKKLARKVFVAFIWSVAFINPKKKHFEVYALIRSVAFIRVLLLFGGGLPYESARH